MCIHMNDVVLPLRSEHIDADVFIIVSYWLRQGRCLDSVEVTVVTM
jgi:hypothetical protein